MLTSKTSTRPASSNASPTSRRSIDTPVTDTRPLAAAEKRFHALFDAAPLAITITREGVVLYANQALANMLGIPEAQQLFGGRLNEYIHPGIREKLISQVRERKVEGFYSQPTRYEVDVCRADGTCIPVRIEISPIALPDGEATLAFGVDLSDERRNQSEIRALLEREQRAARFARELQELSGALAQASSAEDVSAATLECCLRAAGAFGATLFIPHNWDSHASHLEMLNSRGYSAENIAGWGTISVDAPVPIAAAFREAQSVWISDITAPDQIERFPVLSTSTIAGTRCVVALPLGLEGRVMGVLALSFDTHHEFDEEERIFLETLAASCAQALERARLDAEGQEMAQRQRESLALLNTLLDSAPVGFALFDQDNRYVLVNEELARIHALPVQDHVGMHPLELHPDLGERIEEALDRVWESGTPSGEIALTQGHIEEGNSFWHRTMSFYPVRVGSINGEEMIGVGAIVLEQTERVRNDIERNRLLVQLEWERARFEAILQQMPSAVVLAEAPSGRIILGNEQVDRIWRHSSNGGTIADYIHVRKGFDAQGNELSPEEWPIARALSRGEFVSGEEIPIERGNGELGVIRVNAAPIFDKDNRITAAVAVFDDITRRARFESSQRFLAEIGSILVGEPNEQESAEAVARLCVPRATDWCLFLLNKPGQSLYDVTVAGPLEEESLLSPLLKTLLSSNQIQLTEVQQALQMQRGLIAPTLHLSQPNESAKLQNLLAQVGVKDTLLVPLFARGRTLGTLIWFNAQSQRSFGRADLELAEELARRVALTIDSARLLHETQLARDEAQSANRAKDEFLAVVSHELRTPLTPILGWLELLRSPSLDQELRSQAYDVIERNAILQAKLVNDILDMSRITTGKLRLELKDVTLDDIIAQTVESQRTSLNEKHLILRRNVEPNVPVSADPNRLAQVVGNLLQNAVKFTPDEGQITIALRRTINEKLGPVARLEMQDTGSGIEEELLPHIFDRFRQGDSSSTRKAGGLGLGLAIVKHIVELHGGLVGVESAGLSRGATFWFEIPLHHQAKSIEAVPSTHARLVRGRLRGTKILIADDEPDTREMLARLVEEAGATVRLASNGRAALEITAQFEPDAIVSDIGMPEMDGYELRRELLARGHHMPVVALTAYASSGDQAAARAAGFERYLAKPIGARELVEVLCEVLDGAQRS